MKFLKNLTSGFVYMVLAAATQAVADDPAAAKPAANTFQDAVAPVQDGESWFLLARESRQVGDYASAQEALNKAESLSYSPVRISVERARIEVERSNPDAAVAELRQLFVNGFPAVNVFTDDPVLGKLAGNAGFDTLVEEMTVAAYPCENQPRFREFDFWVGEWEVHIADGTYAGHNTIEPMERGCVLLEAWTSATGNTGMSINYLDKASDEWVQIWNAEGGSQINIRGGLTDDGMLLSGTIHYVASGTTAPFRGLWTHLPDGRVRQFFETSNDDGASWVPWFEGFYSRVEAGATSN